MKWILFFYFRIYFSYCYLWTQYLLTDPYPTFKLSYPNRKKKGFSPVSRTPIFIHIQLFSRSNTASIFRIIQFQTLFSSWSDYIFPIFLSPLVFFFVLTQNDETSDTIYANTITTSQFFIKIIPSKGNFIYFFFVKFYISFAPSEIV